MFDRFNLRVVWFDHARSMVKYPGDRADTWARVILWLLPSVAGGVIVWQHYRIPNPGALTPVAGLMAGIFFASVGQLISIRARIADSVQLSQSKRLKALLRESVSGMVLAAVGCMVLSLSLGVLSLVPVQKAGKAAPDLAAKWELLGIGLSALCALLATYVALLFVASARRVYGSYLEAFEGGLPLAKPNRRSGPASASPKNEKAAPSKSSSSA